MERPEERAPNDEKFVEHEEEEAAAAARAIGGDGGEPDDWDPAERPVREAGGGEQEGFEEAERELMENAEHGEGGYGGEFDPGEVESDRSTAVYGEPDHTHTEGDEDDLEGR